jgi:hypothetical protein
VDLCTGERLPCRGEIIGKLYGLCGQEMRERSAQRRKFCQFLPGRQGSEFRNGFVASHQHETLALVRNAVDVLGKVTRYFSNCEGL